MLVFICANWQYNSQIFKVQLQSFLHSQIHVHHQSFIYIQVSRLHQQVVYWSWIYPQATPKDYYDWEQVGRRAERDALKQNLT